MSFLWAKVMSLVTLFALGLILPFGASMLGQDPPFVCGDWQIAGRVGSAGVSSRTDRSLIGVTATYSPAIMRFGTTVVVRNPKYRVMRWSADKFFDEVGNSLKNLGIQDGWIVVVDVQETEGRTADGPGTQVFFKSDSELMTLWDGVFYGMKRLGKPCSDTRYTVPPKTFDTIRSDSTLSPSGE